VGGGCHEWAPRGEGGRGGKARLASQANYQPSNQGMPRPVAPGLPSPAHLKHKPQVVQPDVCKDAVGSFGPDADAPKVHLPSRWLVHPVAQTPSPQAPPGLMPRDHCACMDACELPAERTRARTYVPSMFRSVVFPPPDLPWERERGRGVGSRCSGNM
jgi:hypothetical protein